MVGSTVDLPDILFRTNRLEQLIAKFRPIISMQQLRILTFLRKYLVKQLAQYVPDTLRILIFQRLRPCFFRMMVYDSQNVLVVSVWVSMILIQLDQISLQSVQWKLFVHNH